MDEPSELLGAGDERDAVNAVTAHLDRALETAKEHEMSTSELLGLFHYYAHSIAATFRETALAAADTDEDASG